VRLPQYHGVQAEKGLEQAAVDEQRPRRTVGGDTGGTGVVGVGVWDQTKGGEGAENAGQRRMANPQEELACPLEVKKATAVTRGNGCQSPRQRKCHPLLPSKGPPAGREQYQTAGEEKMELELNRLLPQRQAPDARGRLPAVSAPGEVGLGTDSPHPTPPAPRVHRARAVLLPKQEQWGEQGGRAPGRPKRGPVSK